MTLDQIAEQNWTDPQLAWRILTAWCREVRGCWEYRPNGIDWDVVRGHDPDPELTMLCGTDSVWDAFDRAAYGPGSFWQVCAALAAPPAVADEPVKPTRKRKVTLAAALGAAKKANANVTGATVEADKVTLQFGEPGASGAPANPWDAVLKPQHRQ